MMGVTLKHTVETLQAFESSVAEAFNGGLIKAPVHLDNGNEADLIEIFREFRKGDWCLCTWRSHAKALLAGVPEDVLRAEIMAGRSISICLPEYRVLSSAIVAGICPIALGLAMGIKRSGGKGRVWVFIGDMTNHAGVCHESMHYSGKHELPIVWVVEDNGLSVCTDTGDAWGLGWKLDTRRFMYESKYPHSGAGVRVQF